MARAGVRWGCSPHPRTQVGPVAPRAPRGNAFLVSRRGFSRGASGLRACPMCGSPAVSWADREEVDQRPGRLLVLCGECGTWRAVAVGPWGARTLGRRLRRDRRRMTRVLRRLEHVEAIDVLGATRNRGGPAWNEAAREGGGR